jgi:hypothetical protein
MIKLAGIGFAVTGHRVPLRLAYRFASEKLLNPENPVDPFYKAKPDISKIAAFFRGDLKKF